MQKEMQAQTTLIREEINIIRAGVRKDMDNANGETIQHFDLTLATINTTLNSLKSKYDELARPDGILKVVENISNQLPPPHRTAK